MEQSWPVSSQPVWKNHENDIVTWARFSGNISTPQWSVLTGLYFPQQWAGKSGQYPKRNSSDFIEFPVRGKLNKSASSITRDVRNETMFRNEMFPGDRALMVHICPALNGNKPVFRLNYNHVLNRRKVMFQCKENNSSTVSFPDTM